MQDDFGGQRILANGFENLFGKDRTLPPYRLEVGLSEEPGFGENRTYDLS